jgi:GT2 family glycosyltransferase
LLALNYPDFEVIVIDNRRDARAALPSLGSDPRLHVDVESRRGVSAGRNRGVALATGEIIAFTDDDVVVDRHWLRAMGVRFASEATLEALGGLTLPSELDSPAQLWFEEYYGGFVRGFRAHTMSLREPDDGALFPFSPRSYGAGLNMAFRREALARVGGFDPALGIGTPACGGEDVGVFVAIVLAGGVVGFEPAALVRHHHRRSEHAFMSQVWRYGVGLSAMLCAVVARDPKQLWPILRRVPDGVRHFVRPSRDRSRHAPTYPRRAVVVQIAGVLYGPLAYLRSRRRREVTT